MPGLRSEATLRDVTALFREARGLAIVDNREVRVMVDLDVGTVWIDRRGRSVELRRETGISLYTAASELVTNGRGAIRFFPDGTSTGGRVTLTDGKGEHHVVVDWLTGRISVND